MTITGRLLISLIFFLFCVVGCQQPADQSNQKETALHISGNIPLTGPIAMFCGQYPIGFSMGIDDACEKLGVNRNTFRVDFQDNSGKPSMAATVMQKQLMSNPQIYISGTSAMSDAIAGELSKKKLPHFLVSFDAFMTHNNPTAIRILPNFKLEAPLFINFINKNNGKRVFFFTPNLKAYIEQSDRLILPELQKANIDYQRELFDFDQKNYRGIVAKANNYRPDVIVVSGYAFHIYPIIRALKEYNMDQKSAIISTLDYVDLLHENTPKNEIDGVAFVAPICEIPGKVQTFEHWTSRFKKRSGKLPSYVDAYAYDTARIIVTAYKKTGKIDMNDIINLMPLNFLFTELERV